MNFKRLFQRSILSFIASSGLIPLLKPVLGGRGAILMFHRVRPGKPKTDQNEAFQPNAHLEISPEFLEELLSLIPDWGYEWISLDQVPDFLATRPESHKFVAITLDDGYADNLEFAVPLFQKYKIPYTIFLVPGFIEGQALPWWVLIEEIVRNNASISLSESIGGYKRDIPTDTIEEKQKAFTQLGRQFLTMDQDKVTQTALDLCQTHGIDAQALSANTFLSWAQIKRMATDPLCTFGGHTNHHASLSRLSKRQVREQIVDGLDEIAAKIGQRPEVFAYPFGFKSTAGHREFAIVAEQDLICSVTTRPGVIHDEHGLHLASLPRLSINGLFQKPAYVKALLSGLPFFLANKGRTFDFD